MSQSRQASGSPLKNPLIESKVVKELEKKKSKAKRELDVFEAVRENATRIFFWCDAASTEEAERRQIRRHERT